MNKKISLIIEILDNKSYPLHYNTISTKYNDTCPEKIKTENVNSILSRDIRKKGRISTFIRVSPGVYGLRKWLDTMGGRYSEYLVPRKKTDYLNEYIAVIPKTSLSKLITRTGITETIIDSNNLSKLCKPMHRRKAEKQQEFIQLVSVFVIIHNKKILTFKRTKALPEKRLRNTISINFGGHISYNEAYSMYDPFDINNPNSQISRELHEEVILEKNFTVKPVGYLYDDTSLIGKQHLGLIHMVELSSDNVAISEKKFFIQLKFKSLTEIYNDHDLDFWSNSILQYTNTFFRKQNP